MKLADLEGSILADGYAEGPPPDLGIAAVVADIEAAAEGLCSCCGAVGLEARLFHRGQSYRALAVCDHCGHAIEF